MAVDDSYSKALLHMDGTDASTTFTDESGKTWTARGNAQIDTAQSVFGGASGLFDGTDDYIDTPDSNDWYLDDGNNANYWTIDFWVRFANTNIGGIVSQIKSATEWWSLHCSTGYLYFEAMYGTPQISLYKAFSGSINTWYHAAIVKDGTTYRFFKGGVSLGTGTSTGVLQNYANSLYIGRGRNDSNEYYLNGWLDELRISKGIARWTDDFTPPVYAYGTSPMGNNNIWWG